MALLCYPVTALTVRFVGQRSLVWAFPASAGGIFRFTWVHSVSKRPVLETYVIRADGRLCLKELVFDHEGPGMPSYPEEETTWRIDGGKVTVTGYSSCLDRLDLGVSPFGHRLQTGVWDMNLVSWIGPDRLVSVAIDRIPLILLLWAEAQQWRNSLNRS